MVGVYQRINSNVLLPGKKLFFRGEVVEISLQLEPANLSDYKIADVSPFSGWRNICLAIRMRIYKNKGDMNHYEFILFIIQIGVMLATALTFGQLMRRFHQPAVLGELLGGIVLGPTVFGVISPFLYTSLFPSTGNVTTAREAVLKLGMLFFLFVAGLEINLSHLRQRGWSIIFSGILGILVPFALGFGLVMFIPNLWGPLPQGTPLMFAFLIGAALSISALPVIIRILVDLDLLHKEIGVIVVTAATINDLIGWSMFAVILGSYLPDRSIGQGAWMTLGLSVGLSLFILIMGRFVGGHALRWLAPRISWPSGFIGITAILILFSAAMSEAAGIHAVFGAFLLGVSLSKNSEGFNRAHDTIYQFAISFFAPLYFVSIGLKADFAANFDLPLVLFIFVAACMGKVGGAGLGAWVGGTPWREAMAIGFGMNARGAMEMILASVALEYKIINQRIFVALIVMALITSMLSGPAMQWLLRRRGDIGAQGEREIDG